MIQVCLIEGTAFSSIMKDMNRELEKVDKWLKSNKFITNKTVEDRVHICRKNLVSVNNTKFL